MIDVRRRFFFETVGGVVLGLLIFVFLLAISNSNVKQIDVSNNGRFTMSEQSLKAVQELANPVKVWAFVDERSKPKVQELMQRYQRISSSKFTYELVYPRKQPGFAKRFEVKTPGVAIIEVQKGADDKNPRRERANSISEEEITNALMRLGRQTEVKVYALAGHGERDADGSNEGSLSAFKASLAKEGFQLQTLNLIKDKTIPANCRVLIIPGPTSPLLPKEEELLKEFLKNNGRVLLTLEPETPASYIKLIEEYGIESPEQVIIDEASQMLGAEPVFAAAFAYDPTHPITKDFKQNTIFQLARPVNVAKTLPKDAKVQAIATTAPSAFTIPAADVIGRKELKIEAGKTPPSAINLAVAGSYPHEAANSTTPTPTPAATPGAPPEPKKSPETRLVVVGDSDFICNAMFKLLGARDLSLNIVNWLSESENQISIRPKEADATPLRLTETDMNRQFLFNCIFMPVTLICLGFFLSWRRR